MKIALFQSLQDADIRPGLITERGVIDIAAVMTKGYTPQLTMQGIIDAFEQLRPALDRLALDGDGHGVHMGT